MSPLLFLVPGVSVFEVELLDFKSAPSVPGIKDRILNLFDHEKSAYSQAASPSILSQSFITVFDLKVWDCKYKRGKIRSYICYAYCYLAIFPSIYNQRQQSQHICWTIF